MTNLTELILELRKETTEKGKILLDKLIDCILFELETCRQTISLENKEANKV